MADSETIVTFNKYFDLLSVPKAFRDRIWKIYEVIAMICPDRIEDLLIGEYIKEDGSREYEELDFFSARFIIGVRQFTNSDGFAMTPIAHCISKIILQRQAYDFDSWSDQSRVYLEISLESGDGWHMKTSRENCVQFKHVFQKYVVPNFKVNKF